MLNALSFAHSPPQASGQIKTTPEDFFVEENLGFECTGEGEHLFLWIEKKLLNTEDMAKILAETLELPLRAISYAGLKDKFAVTQQWFSLHLPGIENPNLDALQTENYHVLKTSRHNKKLKIGALKENHFKIKIHDFNFDEEELNARIERIKSEGVPNYFGPQRFGHNGSNLERAKQVLLQNKKIKNHHLRGIYYSAARAFLFNQILDLRVQEKCWQKAVCGDLMMLAGTHSVFHLEEVNDEINQRIIDQDISPAAVLWGKGIERLTDEALNIQNTALRDWQEWCEALEKHKLMRAYRSMVLIPENLKFQDNMFSFTLPKGTFATTLLRELLLINEIV